MKKLIGFSLVLAFCSGTVYAKENAGFQRLSGPTSGNQQLAGCAPSKSRADLDINNVRSPIWINGDMWWDLQGTALYEIPAGSGKMSLFSGAIWIGGIDGNNQLKVAAQTYRQSGSDFWPGPVNTTNATITPDVCLEWDKHWKITFSEVDNFYNEFVVNQNTSYPVPEVIKDWPGNGNTASPYFQDQFLAPFEDVNGDGIYNYLDGDYPRYNLSGVSNCDKNFLLGDQTIWWVFNDVGNTHGETGSVNPVGVEIQAQAFAFSTNDEINNMTFYRYKIINRGAQTLNSTYFGAWVDPDLGNYLDDYVGCDVARGLGFCYNGDAVDDGALGYGGNPPAVGMDFFEGPAADPNDGLDNDRDGVVDEPDELIIMSKFVYYNNDFSNNGNPVSATHHYDYLRGIWKDGSQLLYGGTGYQSGGVPANFMFPGDSDPNWIGTGGQPQPFLWTEDVPCLTCPPNEPSDRRFLQSAGPFTLNSGAVNYITTGAVWARTSSGGPLASVKLLKLADVKAQNLFEACFKVQDGPDAPELSIRELDKEIIISISNPTVSNNYKEQYVEPDLNIPQDSNAKFVFEGYKIYQVIDGSVSVTELKNQDRARLVFQTDLKNSIAQIVNKAFDGDLNAFVPVEEVNGADNGLKHTVRLTTDAFATGDPKLINHKTYYYIAVAYAYDSIADVADPLNPSGPGLFGLPYVQSRKNAFGQGVKVYTAIPHNPTPEANGLSINTTYGDGPEITRLTGVGNGYNLGVDRNIVEIKQDQINEILFNQGLSQIKHPTYQRGHGPVDIRIYDPVKVPAAEFDLWLTDTVAGTGTWILKNNLTGQTYPSEKNLEIPYDQIFPEFGFSISMNQVKEPGENPISGGGLIGGTLTFSGPNQWLGGIPDVDNIPQLDWIRSGDEDQPTDAFVLDSLTYYDDPAQFYEKILGGTWAPFRLVNYTNSPDRIQPAPFYGQVTGAWTHDRLKYLNSVDVVITPDQSKWTRCVVLEMQKDVSKAEGGQFTHLIRKHPSMNKDGSYSTVDSGYSWFPGYAIDLETGERLNIAFGEDSYFSPANNFPNETGGDMKWNPTSTLTTSDGTIVAGGKHYIYVFGHKNTIHRDTLTGAGSLYKPGSVTNQTVLPDDTSYWGPAYDQAQFIHSKLWGITNPSQTAQQRRVEIVYKDVMWVGVPVLVPGQPLLANEARVKLRVTRPYRQYDTGISNSVNNNFPYYRFNTYDLVAKTEQTDVAKSALDLINVVPNPYYAYSNYEINQLDNRIKITNLPPKCVVSIYTTGGTLIRRFNRDIGFNNSDGKVFPERNNDTSLDWDLKNHAGIPIASGMYLINVQADGIGERTLKWFGVIRPLDLDTF